MQAIKFSQVPKGVFQIIFGEFVSKFSYWGVQSILILLLITSYNLTKSQAFFIYGVAATFGFASAFVGGMLGDKSNNIILVLKLGVIFSTLGSVLLIFSNLSLVYLGISFLIFGAGLISPNLDNLLAELHQENKIKSQTSFTLLHGATNLGGLLSPVIFGIIGTATNYHVCFIFSTALYLLYLVILFTSKLIKEFQKRSSGTNYKFFTLLLIPVVIIASLHNAIIFNISLVFLFGYIIIMFSKIYFELEPLKRSIFIKFLFFSTLALLFYSIELQFNNSVLIYTKSFFERTIFTVHIPLNVITAFEPFFVVLLTPAIIYILTKSSILRNPNSDTLKIAIALFFCSIGFYVLGFPLLHHLFVKKSLSWILLSAAIIAITDIIVLPTTLAFLGDNLSQKFRGRLIGGLYLLLSFSGYLSGKLAAYISEPVTNMGKSYVSISWIVLLLAICLFTISILKLYNSRVKDWNSKNGGCNVDT